MKLGKSLSDTDALIKIEETDYDNKRKEVAIFVK